jgi:hypothetical protein
MLSALGTAELISAQDTAVNSVTSLSKAKASTVPVGPVSRIERPMPITAPTPIIIPIPIMVRWKRFSPRESVAVGFWAGLAGAATISVILAAGVGSLLGWEALPVSLFDDSAAGEHQKRDGQETRDHPSKPFGHLYVHAWFL